MSYTSCLEKRNYFIKLKLNTKNKTVTETNYYKSDKRKIKVHSCVYPSKKESISRYQERREYLYRWGYRTID